MADTTEAELRRLYAEEVPTGRFGGGPAEAPPRPITPEQAEANRAALAAAVYTRRGEAA